MNQASEKALVVLSGGQDSTTCLYWALRRFGAGNVEAVTFDYGQRHRVELECARKIAALAGVRQTVLPIDTFAAIGGNALTDDSIAPESGARDDDALPNTFVPGRNLVFLTFAAAFGYTRGARHLVAGVAQTDYSGYPDCRENTLKALEVALRLGMDSRVELHAPLMYLSKAETVTLAQQVGAMDALAWSHTCYNGEVPPCGRCASCELRAKGFAEVGVADPLVARCQAEAQGN
ncbi:7-cyano-7-deazaguanine synthase QueC [Chromobacterium sphagni]|uniref:7-cyano-7-deazaguanine synthase n=1 Tax=Chromobacterium sphagni TaxID=1903179 RepID=A0A1S1X0S6_9NEIS|nr:7-cyano-7-deazaguanine synthase QueC [Chromobacterium sphagni]OHX13131.1 7-cyano-7-deazaguanine synthase QueC [Chromobacterium sphagni]OHX21071.1 7-cyano-7-deazaguanine synthase QueC [Chromobacterium sphagni]